jgi:hypothetical protein
MVVSPTKERLMTDQTKQAAFRGKCEAQRQVSDYQCGLPMQGTKDTNPYAMTTPEWFAYQGAFDSFVNMAFERE